MGVLALVDGCIVEVTRKLAGPDKAPFQHCHFYLLFRLWLRGRESSTLVWQSWAVAAY